MVYLVRSSRTYARIRSLTTGTFNLVVKDRIAFRLSGAPSGLDGLAARANPAVLETLQTYSSRKTLSIRTSHSISTRFPHWERRLGRAAGERNPRKNLVIPNGAESPMRNLLFVGSSKARNGMAFRLGLQTRFNRHELFAHAEAEDRKLRKDPTFGGPCFEGTLQKPTSVSESSPVAGTT